MICAHIGCPAMRLSSAAPVMRISRLTKLTFYTQTAYLLLSYGSLCGLWSPPG